MKKVLITGANSYIGTSFENYMKEHHPNEFQIDTLDMQDPHWKDYDFSGYDSVFHVAGIAHADVGKVSEERKQQYYKINTDLVIETAIKAKKLGVKQFIFMSSMIVYSGCKEICITSNTVPLAENFYGDSKLQADLTVQKLNTDSFKVCVVRPPIIYGKGSKGNYPTLARIATKSPIFPRVKNKKSMLYIENLCEFIRLLITNDESGVFFPQNDEYTNTTEMVQMIAKVKKHYIIIIPGTNLLIKCFKKVPGKIGSMAIKAFGDSFYDMTISEYKEKYRVKSLMDSIWLTEGDN